MSVSPRGGDQPLATFCSLLGFPDAFVEREVLQGELFEAAKHWLQVRRPQKQNHWPALALALTAQAENLLRAVGEASVSDVFAAYPPEEDSETKTVNTLNFTWGDGQSVKLRPLYNKALAVIHNRMLRSHPSNPGHATQSWRAYQDLIALIYQMSPGQRRGFAEFVWNEGVIALPEMTIASVKSRVIRPFEFVLSEMPTAVGGKVPGGSLLQAIAYGYLLADSPNLILESHKVNTGSSRTGMLGDVDGFRGSEPELAAEVKDLDLDESNVDTQLGAFLEDIATAPNATAVVICRSIAPTARELVETRNVTVLTVEDLARTVAVWDLPKQQEALRGIDYYLGRIQRSPEAKQFFRSWLLQNDLESDIVRSAEPVSDDVVRYQDPEVIPPGHRET
ncbi:hypothetical protein ACX80I_02460 [Arthrobacter sp. MDT3-44]